MVVATPSAAAYEATNLTSDLFRSMKNLFTEQVGSVTVPTDRLTSGFRMKTLGRKWGWETSRVKISHHFAVTPTETSSLTATEDNSSLGGKPVEIHAL
ncbi:hypothetical protein TPY_0483 [Sulfobacillus acidophilus TPY]|nr:hypothetical protein TPY_0483 [Sulfobacillus acidophilus TPY]